MLCQAGLLGVPAGGGLPAGVACGPAGVLGAGGPGVLMSIHIIAEPTPNFACNSPTTISNFEFRSLELQRFQTLLKLLPIELHATFRG